MSMRLPSTPTTPMLSSAAYATALPSPVQRVPNGRDVFGGRVVSDRGPEPSRFAAQSTNGPDGLCRQYASRPLDESCCSEPGPPLAPGAAGLPVSTVA